MRSGRMVGTLESQMKGPLRTRLNHGGGHFDFSASSPLRPEEDKLDTSRPSSGSLANDRLLVSRISIAFNQYDTLTSNVLEHSVITGATQLSVVNGSPLTGMKHLNNLLKQIDSKGERINQKGGRMVEDRDE